MLKPTEVLNASLMKVTINGVARYFSEGMSLSDLLESHGFAGKKVAIERNEEIVPRSAFASTLLSDGDRMEIVHFVGGG